MSDIFEGQTLLTLRLDTGLDNLSEATVTKIEYTKPRSNKSGAWDATVDGSFLVYNFQPGDLDEPGEWKTQTRVVIGGLDAPGKIYTLKVNKRLKPLN